MHLDTQILKEDNKLLAQLIRGCDSSSNQVRVLF